MRGEYNATYEKISTGGTGHAIAVKVVYDPSKVGCSELPETFWQNVDPTTLSRQLVTRAINAARRSPCALKSKNHSPSL